MLFNRVNIDLNSNKTEMPFEKGITPNGAKPFQPGQTGNPNGRPKKLPKLDELLADVLGAEKDGVTSAERILKALTAKAEKGDVRAAEILMDRGWGKSVQHIQADINENKKPSWFDNLPVITTTNGAEKES